MGAAVIAHGNSSPVFEPPEHIFDFMALFIEGFIIGHGVFPVLLWRDAGLNAFVDQGGAQPVGVIAAISEEAFGAWQRVQQQGGPFVITDLPLGEQEYQRLAAFIAHRMQFGVQSAFGASDTAG